MTLKSFALAATFVAGIACASARPIEYLVEPLPDVIGCTGDSCTDQIRITYLGVSGFLIEARGSALLTAPSFTNPSLDSVTPTWLRFLRGRAPEIVPNRRLIERLLPAAADQASMILVGHGHYDHLLDVPYIARSRAHNAIVYGSPTVRHMLMGDSALRAAPNRVVAIRGDDVGRRDHAGRWFASADRTFRVMALHANHAPTVNLFRWGAMFAAGTLDEDMTQLPRRASDWKLGEPYAYIIDIMARDGTTTVFRIYYQDAPATAPLGFPPLALGGRAFDLAILCVATAQNVDPVSPDSLLLVLRPKYVIASHWESFFRPQTQPLRLNPASDVDDFNLSLMRNLATEARWWMPMPRTTLRFGVEK